MQIGRNDPCPCGSGKKYKKCCLEKDAVPSDVLLFRRLSEVIDRLIDRLLRHADQVFGTGAVAVAMREFLVWPEPEDEVDDTVMDRAEQLFWPWYLFNWEYDAVDAEADLSGPAEKTVAELYTEALGDSLDPIEKLLIDSLNREPYSFWEVLEVEPGVSLKLVDLLREVRMSVRAPAGSDHVQIGDLLFGRAVMVANVGMVVGVGQTIIPSTLKPDVLGVRDWLLSGGQPITKDTLWDWDAEIREWYFDIEQCLYGDPDPDQYEDYDTDFPQTAFDDESSTQEAMEWMEDPEVLEQLAEVVSGFWENWLDDENDALDGLSPRQAAKTEHGRRAVVALLDDMEKKNGPHSNMTDEKRLGVRWARDILGLT